MKATLKLDYNDRINWAHQQDYRYSVDMSDLSRHKVIERVKFDPKLTWQELKVDLDLPEDLRTFQERAYKIYLLGYRRMIEALKFPHSKQHIRGNCSMIFRKKSGQSTRVEPLRGNSAKPALTRT